jgi:hypothetical protein
MKKILFVSQFILLAALIAPTHAGTNIETSGKEYRGKKKTITAHVKKIKNTDWVNYETAQQFYLDFPAAVNVKWHQGNFAEATFDDGSIQKTAYYDMNNKLIGTTADAAYSGLPEKARKDIQKNFPGYDVTHVILFKDNTDNDTDMFLYNTPFEDEDNYFAEIRNGSKAEVLKIDMDGQVSFFQNL